MSRNDFDILVDETLNLIHFCHGTDPFRPESLAAEDRSNGHIPDKCGVLFRVKKSRGFFRFHCFFSSNLREDYYEFLEGLRDLEMIEGMKAQVDPGLWARSVHWFETEDLPMAKAICEQMGGIKFPFSPDTPFTNGEGQDFWWMNVAENQLQIHFSCPQSQFSSTYVRSESENWVCLGPLGLKEFLFLRLDKIREILRFLLPLEDLSIGGGDTQWINMSVSPVTTGFYDFKNLFLQGEPWDELLEILKAETDPDSYFFFKEMMSFRKFWLKVGPLLLEE